MREALLLQGVDQGCCRGTRRHARLRNKEALAYLEAAVGVVARLDRGDRELLRAILLDVVTRGLDRCDHRSGAEKGAHHRLCG